MKTTHIVLGAVLTLSAITAAVAPAAQTAATNSCKTNPFLRIVGAAGQVVEMGANHNCSVQPVCTHGGAHASFLNIRGAAGQTVQMGAQTAGSHNDCDDTSEPIDDHDYCDTNAYLDIRGAAGQVVQMGAGATDCDDEEPETPVEEPETPIEEPETPVEEPETPVEEPDNPETETPVEEEADDETEVEVKTASTEKVTKLPTTGIDFSGLLIGLSGAVAAGAVYAVSFLRRQ